MDRSELIIKINVIKQLGTPIEDLISLIDEQNKEVAIDFSVWIFNNEYTYMSDNQWLDFEGKTIFSNDLYNTYLQSKQITND